MKKDCNIKTLLQNDIEAEAFPPPPTLNTKRHGVCYILVQSGPKGMGYIYLTGCFADQPKEINIC